MTASPSLKSQSLYKAEYQRRRSADDRMLQLRHRARAWKQCGCRGSACNSEKENGSIMGHTWLLALALVERPSIMAAVDFIHAVKATLELVQHLVSSRDLDIAGLEPFREWR